MGLLSSATWPQFLLLSYKNQTPVRPTALPLLRDQQLTPSHPAFPFVGRTFWTFDSSFSPVKTPVTASESDLRKRPNAGVLSSSGVEAPWWAGQWPPVCLPFRASSQMAIRPFTPSPPPPLKFRTAGFPQYGFKRAVSGDLHGPCHLYARSRPRAFYPWWDFRPSGTRGL
jgi:hypothetical protein